MNRATAEYINNMMLDFSDQIADSCGVVKERCTAKEVEAYMRPVAHISALMFDVLDTIYVQYPDLKPDGFAD